MAKTTSALDWGSTNASENMALVPTFDRIRAILPALLIQVGGYWVLRQDGTTITNQELRGNDSLSTVPVNLHCDLDIAGVLLKDQNAAKFCAQLKAALASGSPFDFEDAMKTMAPGFDTNAMDKVNRFLYQNGKSFNDVAAQVAAAL